MSYSSVWVQLYYQGEETNDRDPVEIIPIPRNIGALKAAVLPELGPALLGEVKVYAPGTTPPFSLDKAIDPGDPVPTSTTSKNSLIVVAPAPAPHPPGQKEEKLPKIEHKLIIKQLRLLKLVSEEVNRQKKSRLNCWERESLRTTGSKRDLEFRKNVIRHYQRESRTGKSVKCQILDEYVRHSTAENTIIAAHIWKAETKGKYLDKFGLCHTDVNNARNGIFVTIGIKEAFDNQQVCFLYNILSKELCLWVADKTILSDKIKGSNPQKTFADVHQKPLLCPDQDHMPFRRLLAWHARLTLELWKDSVQVSNYTSAYDLSPNRQGATLDPIAQAINDMVEPGEDASVSGS